MRGHLIQEKGRAGWQDIPVPEIGPCDADVRPMAVAACTAGVHLIDSLSLPSAPGKGTGHEAAGVTETACSLVTGLTPGDRVHLSYPLALPPASRRRRVGGGQGPARACIGTLRS